jgi:tRNA threonylcarbamoyladenosine biosynthesis protein TsaE
MVTLISKSPEDTLDLGRQWGREARAGQVIGLDGDLGAGKTQLVKGLAEGLGIRARVHSPTFALLHVYEGGRTVLHHLDLYRLNNPEEVFSAGLEDYLFNPPGVAVIEWLSRWAGPFGSAPPRNPWPAGFRWVDLEVVDELTRRIRYEDFGH